MTTESITDYYIYALIVWTVAVVGILAIITWCKHKEEEYDPYEFCRDLQVDEDKKNETL